MDDRKAELSQLTAELRDEDAIDDAFLAKSFTDRLVIIDVEHGEAVPSAVAHRLAEHDVLPADDVYGDEAAGSFAGSIGDATRHNFVDVLTRESH